MKIWTILILGFGLILNTACGNYTKLAKGQSNNTTKIEATEGIKTDQLGLYIGEYSNEEANLHFVFTEKEGKLHGMLKGDPEIVKFKNTGPHLFVGIDVPVSVLFDITDENPKAIAINMQLPDKEMIAKRIN